MKIPQKTYILRTPEIRENAKRDLDSLTLKDEDGNLWECLIRRHVTPRSMSQNATLFGIAYPPLMEHVGLRGEKGREEIHEYFCGEFFGWNKHDVLGRTKMTPKRTTTTNEEGHRDILPMAEFNKFWEFVQDTAAGYGVAIPDPDPMKRSGRNKPKPQVPE